MHARREHWRTVGKNGSSYTLPSVREFVTKWKHWILRQPDQVSKTETMARGGHEAPICGNQ